MDPTSDESFSNDRILKEAESLLNLIKKDEAEQLVSFYDKYKGNSSFDKNKFNQLAFALLFSNVRVILFSASYQGKKVCDDVELYFKILCDDEWVLRYNRLPEKGYDPVGTPYYEKYWPVLRGLEEKSYYLEWAQEFLKEAGIEEQDQAILSKLYLIFKNNYGEVLKYVSNMFPTWERI